MMSLVRWYRSSWVGETACLAILPALISFVMLWPALLGLRVFAPTDIVAADPLIGDARLGKIEPQNPLLSDVVDVFIPWKLYARSEMWQGRFPLWNPYNGLGTHFHASLQSQLLSPLNLLWMLLPPLWGLGAITALKWTLCGLGMALLLRALGLGMLPAIFGSVALQLSGPVVGWLQWPIVEGLAWVPWMLWVALRWVDTLNLRWLQALTFLVAAEILAGHIETSFHSLAFLSVFSLAALISAGANPLAGETASPRRKYAVQRWLGLLGAGVLGVGISAAQLLPFLNILTSSYQWEVREGVQVQYISMPAPNALMWLSPNGFGWPDAYFGPSNWAEANPYVGAITLLLAVWALAASISSLLARKKSLSSIRTALSPRKPFFWIGLLAISISMAYGIPPLSSLRELPGFNSSFNSRLISVAGPCIIVLAAMGLHRLLSARISILTRAWAAALLLLGLLGMLWLVGGIQVWFVSSLKFESYTRAWMLWSGGLFCLSAVLVLARLLGWLRPQVFGILVLAFLLLDLGRATWNFNSTTPKQMFYPTNRLTLFLANLGPEQRVAIVGKYAESNMLLGIRVPDYRMYDPTQSSRYIAHARLLTPATFRTAFREQDASYTGHMVLVQPSAIHLSAVGLRWLVTDLSEDPNSWQPAPPDGPIYVPILRDNGFVVWENRFARPFAYFVERFQVAPDEAIMERRMRALTLDRVNQAHIEAPGGVLPLEISSSDNGEPVTENEVSALKVERPAPGTLRIRVTAERNRFLVVNETWADGWRAELDNSPVPIYRVNFVAQGVVVAQGEHTVTFTYDPPAFKWGVGISVAALVGWLGLIFFSVKGRRREIVPIERADAN